MNAFSRSWSLTKLSFRVIGQDKELLLFPLIAMFLSVGYLLALLFPTILLELSRNGSVEWTVADYIITFIAYLGLSFIGTFSNMCVVYTAKVRFAGGNATFGESLGFTFKRIHQVLGWAAVSATVGLVFHAIDQAASKAGAIGKIVVGIVRALLGAVWSAITLFVIPSMVYRGTGPIDAIKDSVRVLRKTWGESLIGSLGFGLVQFLFVLLGVGVFGGAFAGLISMNAGSGPMIAIIVLAVVYFVGLTFAFLLARMIFNTALYAYASEGTVALGYDRELLQSAFRTNA
ncbi:MAG: hypothetical protein IAG13_00595 [Deltaproteobacteria bacterium]|nr:hypothetical protein [Nannocystaceae bacterium]